MTSHQNLQPTPPHTDDPKPTQPGSSTTNAKRWTQALAFGIGLLVILGVATAILLPRLVDLPVVIATATKAVEDSTGRTLSITGPVSLRE